MESFSFQKWACMTMTMALLALVLIENSMALKCLSATLYKPPGVPANRLREEECREPTNSACISFIQPGDWRTKWCGSTEKLEQLVGGKDTCTTEPWNQYKEKEMRLNYRYGSRDFHKKNQTEDEYVKEHLDRYTFQTYSDVDLNQDITMCSCSTDLCNTDANDDLLNQQSAGKPIPTLLPENEWYTTPAPSKNDPGPSNRPWNSNGAAATLLADSGNLMTVMFLVTALAVLAVRVPGFLGRQ